MRLGRDKKPGFDSEFVGCYLKFILAVFRPMPLRPLPKGE